MSPRLLWAAAVVAAAFAMPAEATFHFFRVDQVFSNADGTVQYVVMRESANANGEQFWAGQALRTTNNAGLAKQFPFPANLPSGNTASRSVLIATPAFAALGIVTPDYTMPERFVPTDGGTLNFANVDQITLPPLPTDGVTAVNRNGATVAATPRNFADATATMTPQAVTSVEFYNAALDHYFISSLAPDIDALDTGRFPGWVRTGESFRVFPSQAAGGAGVTPVCRIIIPPPFGDSHFFGRSVEECAGTLAKFPFMTQETAAAFFITLPTTGVCPAGTIPIYRVFSDRADANHRYMTNRDLRTQMAAMGWAVEGDGEDFVVMCAPPAATSAGATAPPDPPPPEMPPPEMPPPPGCTPGYGGEYCPP
jgi:hypothetical protein